jgi:hypothetical protein
MMKRVLAIVLGLCLLSGLSVNADIDTIEGSTIAGGGAAEAGCIDGASFTYNGDHSSGTNYACDSASAALEGTNTGATVSSDYVVFDAANERIKWTIDSTELPRGQGTIFATIYIIDDDSDTDIDTTDFMEIYIDADNNIICQIDGGTDRVVCYYEGDASPQSGLSSGTAAFDTEYRFGYTYDTDAGSNEHSISFVTKGSGTSWSDANDDITEVTSDFNSFVMGEESANNGSNEEIRLYDVEIYNTHKATDQNP